METQTINHNKIKEQSTNNIIENYLRRLQASKTTIEKYKQLDLLYKHYLIQSNELYCLIKKLKNNSRYQYSLFKIELNGSNVVVALNIFGSSVNKGKMEGKYGGEIKKWEFNNYIEKSYEEQVKAIKEIGDYMIANLILIDVFTENFENAEYSQGAVKISNVIHLSY